MRPYFWRKRENNVRTKRRITVTGRKIKKIRADLGLTRKAFSEYIGNPLRNLEEWEAGRRKMPEYLLRMMTYYIKMSQYLEQNRIKEEIERMVFNEKE